jgi:hypothetical protein
MSKASAPPITALRHGFADYGASVVARANPDSSGRQPGDSRRWKISLTIVADTLRVRLWPADELVTLPLPDPGMWSTLDALLERGTQPIVRWTMAALDELIRSRFAGSAQVSRVDDEYVIQPHGPFHRVLARLHRDRAGVVATCEIRHGPQTGARKDRALIPRRLPRPGKR